jgi:class 3 adenylate cyclase
MAFNGSGVAVDCRAVRLRQSHKRQAGQIFMQIRKIIISVLYITARRKAQFYKKQSVEQKGVSLAEPVRNFRPGANDPEPEVAQLKRELCEALEQQAATSEVLRVISSSPGDLEPAFATMLEKAVRICDATFGNIYRWDGDALQLVATHNTPPAYAEHRKHSPFRAEQDNAVARMIKSKAVVHVCDVAASETYTHRCDPSVVAAVELGRIRSALVVPMLKDEELVGAFIVSRQEVRPFTDKQIALVTSFAAQAVIAIENARLLCELRQRTGELERSYELVRQQAALLETQAQQLEQRVTEQVGEIERMGRLRRFLPPQIADLIVASGTEKQLESHRREITALFCDLRDFTGFSESSDPEDVMALLREYHATIGDIIVRYGGTLERYAGDGVMVVFNDPIPVSNPPLQAVQMALEMRVAISALMERWRQRGHDVGFGIGIAHGYATLGTIGFEGRFDYAAIGTVSNVASRLCDEAKPGQVLISPRVLLAVEDAVIAEQVGELALKGIRLPVAAYNVIAAVAPKGALGSAPAEPMSETLIRSPVAA